MKNDLLYVLFCVVMMFTLWAALNAWVLFVQWSVRQQVPLWFW